MKKTKLFYFTRYCSISFSMIYKQKKYSSWAFGSYTSIEKFNMKLRFGNELKKKNGVPIDFLNYNREQFNTLAI